MSGVKVFWTEPTGKVKIALRRYHSSSDDNKCPGEWGYHNGHNWLGEFPAKQGTQCEWDPTKYYLGSQDDFTTDDDPRWPIKCDHCDYIFTDNDTKQIFQEQIYRRPDTGEEHTLRNHVPGMMWDAWWCGVEWRGPDGIVLIVVLPNGREWIVDSVASNCPIPDQPHKCWVRHGDPRTGNVHVDKDGVTCTAGAGSIVAGDYHGFLHHGYLTT